MNISSPGCRWFLLGCLSASKHNITTVTIQPNSVTAHQRNQPGRHNSNATASSAGVQQRFAGVGEVLLVHVASCRADTVAIHSPRNDIWANTHEAGMPCFCFLPSLAGCRQAMLRPVGVGDCFWAVGSTPGAVSLGRPSTCLPSAARRWGTRGAVHCREIVIPSAD